ncbi:cell wall anchor protein [Micromonospora endolithica]|uniref:cell wall anchor protein n=1 Tax=Micromonospora endolithica TaxID=230091 RepID=UPI0011AD1C66|nr:cell wall anchor protein [Micromonospora endolithica]TWJ24557.1 hypothetical protein JD76_04709 [Micromonospora endolithica]
MIFRNRPLVRLGAAALLASGALTAFGVPAYAADTAADLSVEVTGTRVAAGAQDKVAFAKIKNNGPGTPDNFVVDVDVSKIDFAKVAVVPVTEGPCTIDGDEQPTRFSCLVDDKTVPGPGETLEVALVTFKAEEGVELPYTAPFTVTVKSDGDTAADNDSASAELVLTDESGVDMGIVVPDVKFQADGSEKPPLLVPGAETLVHVELINQGDVIANGIKLDLTLPKGATFTEDLRECTYSPDRRVANCPTPLLQVAPGDILIGSFPVKVDADVKAPIALQGGSGTVTALGELPATSANVAATKKTLPSFLKAATAEQAAEVREIDETDNTDAYAVIVAAKGGSGGGGDDDGDGPGLPVTGAKAGLIGGIGGAVLLAGGLMFLMARRRRVVLVTPGDERPTA